MTLVQLVALEPQAPLEALIARLEQLSGERRCLPRRLHPRRLPPPLPGPRRPRAARKVRAAGTSALPAAAPPPPRAMPEQVEAREATNADAEASNNDEAAHGTPSPDAPASETSREEAKAPGSPSAARAACRDSWRGRVVRGAQHGTARRGPEAGEPDAPTAAAGDASAEPEEAQTRADGHGAAADPAEPENAPADGSPTELSFDLARARQRHPRRSPGIRRAPRRRVLRPGSRRPRARRDPSELRGRFAAEALTALHAESSEHGADGLRFELTDTEEFSAAQRERAHHVQSVEKAEHEAGCAASKHGLGSTQR